MTITFQEAIELCKQNQFVYGYADNYPPKKGMIHEDAYNRYSRNSIFVPNESLFEKQTDSKVRACTLEYTRNMADAVMGYNRILYSQIQYHTEQIQELTNKLIMTIPKEP